ncbi:MAG: ion transporter [Lachnospiraceae bacterium]|jgi:voltage-gated potassium channel|nr:ion transporter [Lachnospiraceae bacterium]
MRKRIYEIVEKAEDNDIVSHIYDVFMIVVIALSLIPLVFKNEYVILNVIDKVTVVIFIIDYLLRWITADYRYEKKNVVSFIKYPFSAMAIIDLLSILPSLSLLNKGFKILRVLRMIRALRVVRVFKAMRYSKSLILIANVLKASRDSLIAVCALAGGYILVSALIIFNVEPDSFNTFFDAVYWATVSLTTVGYGDIYPITTIGRIITMVSSVFGIAIVALPAGIITAGYMNELQKDKDNNK